MASPSAQVEAKEKDAGTTEDNAQRDANGDARFGTRAETGC